MKIIKIICIAAICCCFAFSAARAADSIEKITLPSSNVYTWVKAKEWTKINLLTFSKARKARLYNGYSDRRVSEMKYAKSIGDIESITKSLSRFQTQKQKALELAEKANDKTIMEGIREKTIEQQRTMTELQLQMDDSTDLQKEVVNTQKQVATRTVETVKVVEGDDQATTVDKQIWTVWRDPNADVNGKLPELPAKLEYAPGTAPGGTGGWVYEGGSKQVWAPGTSGGGTATNQQSGNVVEGGQGGTASGGQSGNVVEGGQGGTASGTTSGSSGNTVVGE